MRNRHRGNVQMSFWSLKKTGFIVRRLPNQSAVNGAPETREKKTRCQVLVCARHGRKTTRCQVLVCARHPLNFLRPKAELSAIADTQSLVSGACKTTAYEQEG